ncbi:MAG: zinc dependent phospholipase C family protein [Firmicutes bacterium]|nr:zinc dependent phospholipase C family protein [Bacillota bacterium]
MAFTMTHLIISEHVFKIFPSHIKNLPQFYLGSIAPDAAHQRPNYTSEYKKTSHLVTGDEQWGLITKTDEWESNLIEFFAKHKNTENHDFIVGYCTHVLGDIYNTINVWNPFRLKYADELKEISYGNIHHQECNKLDIELALTYEGRNDFWFYLAKSKSIDLPGILYATEIDKQKDLILNSWYKGKERQDISSNKIRTYESEMEFILNATDYVARIFHENL